MNDEAVETDGAADALAVMTAERDGLRAALAASLAREQALAGEMRQRVRNDFAVVRSVFARTIDNAATLDHVAIHFPSRLDTLARWQARSLLNPEPGCDLATLIADELRVFGAEADPRVSVRGPPMTLDWRRAGAFALAIHELAANSVKFGVLAGRGRGGRLAIGWAGDADRLDVEWNEGGAVDPVAAAPATGFGRAYIEQALPYQLDAETSFELRDEGVRCRMSIPLGG